MSAKWRALALLICVSGGLVGLLGSALQEALHGGLLSPFLAVPVIEEALKPSGVYLLVARWPQVLSSRLYIASLTALSGLTFGIVENLIYLNVYFPEHSHALVLIRYTAGLLLHTSASFIVGLGINSKLVAAVNGDIPLFSFNKRYFIIAMAMHSAYNVAAVVLSGYLK